MLKIRLARGGAVHKPFYFIVVANSKSARDSGYIEKIGYHNPLIEHGEQKGTHLRFSIDSERLKYWISVGARPTNIVVNLCKKNGVTLLEKFVKKVLITENEFKGKSKKDVKKILADRKAQEEKNRKEKAEKLKQQQQEKTA